MKVSQAIDAVQRACCLECYFEDQSIVIDPQLVGYDQDRRPVVLGVDRKALAGAPLGECVVVHLDTATRLDVSGYMSDGLRSEYTESMAGLSEILCKATRFD